jgi:rhodanese-related sulfurtransferase
MRHLLPTQTWALMQADPSVVMIDIRMEIESMYVGRPPGAIHVPWYEYPEFTPNVADFCAVIENEVGNKNKTVVLLCRSGQRSVDAGNALEAAGFTDVVNVLHGFEGDLDAKFHRSSVNGWRFDGLPWEQM